MALCTTTTTTRPFAATRAVPARHPAAAPPRASTSTSSTSTTRRAGVIAHSDNPVRAALSGLASGIYKATASMQAVDSSLPPLWQGLMKLDKAAVQTALRQGADANMVNANGDTPLLFIAREGHYKYPPAEIPALLVQSGANLEATDANGRTALQVALLSGWQNIALELINSGAKTDGVPSIKAQLTCPDCKRVVADLRL